MRLKNINWEENIDGILKGEIIVNNCNSPLRRWILKKEYLEYKCNSCGIKEWQNKEITLDLDHIDGDRSNNKLKNLRFLCPNCHSQTKTYRGKNIKTKKPPLKSYTENIIFLYKQGYSIKKILTKLGYSEGSNPHTIKKILIKNNIKLREKKVVKKKIYKQQSLKRQEKINKVKNSNIDFSKKTWGTEVAKILDKSPQYCLTFVKKYLPEILDVEKQIKSTREEIIENRIKSFKESNLDSNDEDFYIKLGDLYGISKWASKRFYQKYLK